MGKQTKARSRQQNIGILLAAVGLAIAIVIITIIIISNNQRGRYVDSDFDADAFFLQESGDTLKYALFNNEGKRLTGFDYIFTDSFVDGYALVQNDNEQYGVIDETGKMSIGFDKYDTLESQSGFYIAIKDDNSSVVLGDGRIVADQYDELITTYDSPFAIIKKADDYMVYSVKGDHLATFKSENVPTIESGDDRSITVVNYDGHVMFFNNMTHKLDLIRDTDKTYSIGSVSASKKVVYLNDAIYANGKLVDLGDACQSIDYIENLVVSDGYAVCVNEDSKKLIRHGSVSDVVVDENTLIFDEDHYAFLNLETNNLEVYVNGGMKPTINLEDGIADVVQNGYVIQYYDEENPHSELYNLDGHHIFTSSNSGSDFEGIANNKLYAVESGDPSQTERFYLINSNGDKLSKNYLFMYGVYSYPTDYNYIVAQTLDGKADIIDNDGNVTYTSDYSSCFFAERLEYFICSDEEGNNNIVIDARNKKAISGLSLEGELNYQKNGYFALRTTDKIEFYSKNGEKFHEYSLATE